MELYRTTVKEGTDEPITDTTEILKAHFAEYSRFVADFEGPASQVIEPRKISRLTGAQFEELSTDIYDELLRRKNICLRVTRAKEGVEVPFLSFRLDFHPKRNQARQKLAELSASRFEEITNDVYLELIRRFPELVGKGDRSSTASTLVTPPPTYDETMSKIPPSTHTKSRRSSFVSLLSFLRFG